MSGPNPLFSPVKVGTWNVAHRIVYAVSYASSGYKLAHFLCHACHSDYALLGQQPLTRCRCPSGNEMPAEGAVYYSQRATQGGLMISEATGENPRLRLNELVCVVSD